MKELEDDAMNVLEDGSGCHVKTTMVEAYVICDRDAYVFI